MYKKLLLPVDLGEREMAHRAIDAALALAKADETQLRLLTVQQYVPLALTEYVPTDFDEQLRETTEKELSELAATVEFPKDRVSTVLRVGAVYPEVLAEAEEWGADLIVVGSHRPSMATYLLGSNAKTIVRHAKCSVLVVRSQS